MLLNKKKYEAHAFLRRFLTGKSFGRFNT